MNKQDYINIAASLNELVKIKEKEVERLEADLAEGHVKRTLVQRLNSEINEAKESIEALLLEAGKRE